MDRSPKQSIMDPSQCQPTNNTIYFKQVTYVLFLGELSDLFIQS